MQTFSGMQRSGNDALVVKTLLFLLLIFIYEPLTTLLIYLPPLLVVGAWYIFHSHGGERVGWLLYFYMFEVDHGLPFFSLFATLILFGFVLKRLREYIACEGCLFFLASLLFYTLFIIVVWLYKLLFSIEFLIDYKLLFYYAFIDGLLYYAF